MSEQRILETFPPLAAVAKALAARMDIELAYVFGSTSRGQRRRDSDLDVAVLFSAPIAPREELVLRETLEAVAGVPVDLVVLNDVAPLLAHEVVSDGKPILVRNDETKALFELRTQAKYLDTAHLRRVQMDYLRDRVKQRANAD